MTLAADDLGFLSGVVIVDRLRTVQGVGLDVSEHVQRFKESCQGVGIELPKSSELIEQVRACVAQHRQDFGSRDFSVVMLATPGRVSNHWLQPTLRFQAVPIDWKRLAGFYRLGQTLTVASARNIPAACWSPTIKTRARLQYYLADREACALTGQSTAAGLLLDVDGYVTETSAANVIVVEGERLLIPHLHKTLEGISLRRTLRLAAKLGYEVQQIDIAPARAEQANAVWLCGSTGCLWAAAQLGDRCFKDACRQPMYERLVEAWQQDIGCDYVGQALQFA